LVVHNALFTIATCTTDLTASSDIFLTFLVNIDEYHKQEKKEKLNQS